MYVDDWITGQDTREEALFISRHAKNIMKEAGMEMRKWISNDTVLMAQWAAEGFDTHPMDASIRLGTNKTKVLGMAWQTLDDCLTLDTKGLLEFVSINENTKRFMLQTIGKIFDPGIALTLYYKNKMSHTRTLDKKKITWDEILPPKLKEKWLIWCKELPLLDNLRIPRLVLDSTNDEVSDLIEIHIFCDASKLAYGAAAYVKLLGALVAARLSSRVQEIVRKKKECKVFHWTDSKIVLFWIKGSSKRWKQFVANRVQEISELTDPDSWFHCSGQDNPSDFLSRGLSVDTLISNNKWWTGPAFLRTDELPKTVSECPELNEVDYLPELKSKDSKEHTVLTLNFNQTCFDHLLSRSNKFLTIVRVLSFLYRFLFNIRNPTNKKTGPLTSDEMKEAEIYLMKQVQLSSFYKEIRAMQNGDDICNKSKILNLSPFLDDKGIIRVGGRLKHSRLPYLSKHPILLPAKRKLTIIIVKYYHEKYFHLGPQHLLYQKHLEDFLRGRIIGRLECGLTQLEVSEELGIAQSVISRLWQQFQDDATGMTVSRQTVYRRLGHIGLYARRPVRCVPLTATHCCLRLTWSREHALWTPQQWSCVMFSDQSRFSLQSDSRRTGTEERQVPVTTKRTPLNDTVTVEQDGSFGEELFLVPELTCMFRV
ncbi:integrase catalytic domain-containing protein [Trichonephila clavipes]|uniref:Integrase catalytic domain-containing protein n=1 Tax=Trichonephila clavipes TaxID=2585209 RepID=A0A8X6WJ13_TRICX|nr:integrase catalytic domain-containing protein [Trichonephila clavipes]